MSQMIEKLTKFLLNISPDLNPYAATANFLDGLFQLASPPSWAVHLERVFVLPFGIMLCQSASLIYFRMMSHRFYLFKLNELGLVQGDCSNLCSIGYLIYSVLTLVDMISKQLLAGHRYQAWQIFLFGTKFIVALDTSWVFLWVCVCHCASLKWRSSTSQTEVGRTIIPRYLPWTLHALLLGARLGSAISIIWIFAIAIQEYSLMEDIVRPVTEALLHAASSYSPDTYNASNLWMILLPSNQALSHLNITSRLIRIGISLYLCAGGILCLAYIPFLTILLRGMYSGPALPAMKRDEELGASSQTAQRIISRMNESITPQRDATVLHALLAYISTLVHLPVLIWAISPKSVLFFLDRSWLVGIQLGIHVPFSITGNICLLILNINAYRTFRVFRQAKSFCIQTARKKSTVIILSEVEVESRIEK